MSPSPTMPTRRDARRATRTRRLFAAAATGAVVAMSAWGPMAFASHYQASLDGAGLQDPSLFEIDTDANLTLDSPAIMDFDWMNVEQTLNLDKINGTGDDSYAGGVKEDTACPAATTDSIPPNKSDLIQFGAWEEEGSPGYLHLYWVRVTEPTGTTLMDFEFNQSEANCPSGPNKVRTAGDLLIEYSIDQGGAQANMTLREWSGTAWGPATDIDGSAQASGTINSSPITKMDTLTQDQSARTFGEASVDLNLIFDDTKCESFGSAMLKSRSSDSFTSQLKDFVAPIPLTLTNCGQVEITKQTTPDGSTQLFDYTKAFGTDPATGNTFDLADGDTESFEGVLFGTGYTVTEDELPAGWEFTNLDCSASTGDVSYTVDLTTRTVTFDIQDSNDFLKCTYHNQALADLTIVKQVNDDPGTDDFDFTSAGGLDPGTFTLTPTGTGAAGADETTYTGIATGTYTVDETVPTGWNLVSASCDNGDDPTAAINLGAGDDVTCTFVNERERGAIDITKLRKHAAAEGGEGPHADVTFTVTDAADNVIDTVVTDASGQACVGGLLYGTYTVTETVPDNYVSADASKDVAVSAEAACGDEAAADVSFMNTPLTDVTVSVDSLVDDGTASTIVCVDGNGDAVDSDVTNAPGDVSLTIEDLEPTAPTATLVCTITVDP
ncbi:MSCRAMM family protein [Ornithinimicrobium tianjinense]|uniref:Cna protein B-type domain-containing protein n=1 Tax=Ornithinimicrobium tianjinense TaxID=1195761 RepID=A0A917BKL0_9MICO|nr:SpaA isopeptide-forming pilin-related protein [Ornithinimicrobium tianjinense]GGF45673.1 hypothetical protein GCM10011366_11760 [Ornithinimicrobium tianjinense]